MLFFLYLCFNVPATSKIYTYGHPLSLHDALPIYPLGSSSCLQGVTTAVMGNCGFTLAPSSKSGRALVVRNLERAEDISGAAMEAGIDWHWTTRSEEHTSELQSLMRISYAVFCLKKKT